jgi:hypothetical protein
MSGVALAWRFDWFLGGAQVRGSLDFTCRNAQTSKARTARAGPPTEVERFLVLDLYDSCDLK